MAAASKSTEEPRSGIDRAPEADEKRHADYILRVGAETGGKGEEQRLRWRHRGGTPSAQVHLELGSITRV
jgi:hypothetical protein